MVDAISVRKTARSSAVAVDNMGTSGLEEEAGSIAVLEKCRLGDSGEGRP